MCVKLIHGMYVLLLSLLFFHCFPFFFPLLVCYTYCVFYVHVYYSKAYQYTSTLCTHIAEDNNTRVLFEKVLATMPADRTKLGCCICFTAFATSYTLPCHCYREVWDKYVEFESNVGDLASLLKVEKKRAAAMKADSKLVT